jgi:hypothetical protein
MFKIIAKSNPFIGAAIFFMPIVLVFFLGSQMAYSQVKSRYEAYQNIAEVSRLSDLAQLPAGQVVMLRGRIAPESCRVTPTAVCDSAEQPIIFRERPAGDREVRFREEFEKFFPEFIMELADGPIMIVPSQTREPIFQHELQIVSAGDRERSGFGIGDVVTVQGQWQPSPAPRLGEVTGVTGAGKAGLMQEWQLAFQQVSWARNGLGLLSLLSLVLLWVQLRRVKANKAREETWPPQKTTTTPIV